MTQITIPFASKNASPSLVMEHFQGYLQDKSSSRGPLAGAVNTDIELDDPRITVDYFNVTCVEEHGDEIFVSVCLDFSSYSGCKDQYYASEEDGCLTGQRGEYGWAFESHKPRLKPSPIDEL
jgi:hypothetical protein